MIEKNIFQTWKSKTEMPSNFAYWRSTVVDLNPGFEYFFWDDADNRAFIAEHYPWFVKTYDGYPQEIHRVDAVRYFWLYHFGGIYADLDTECLQPLSDLCATYSGVVLGRMGEDNAFIHSIPNAIMASSARHPFWLFIFHRLMFPRAERDNPEDRTGSIMLTFAVEDHERGDDVDATIASIKQLLPAELYPQANASPISVLPSNAFYPINWANPIHEKFFRKRIIYQGNMLSKEKVKSLFPNSMMVTYWAHSWYRSDASR